MLDFSIFFQFNTFEVPDDVMMSHPGSTTEWKMIALALPSIQSQVPFPDVPPTFFNSFTIGSTLEILFYINNIFLLV